jgi:hypothetical protein
MKQYVNHETFLKGVYIDKKDGNSFRTIKNQ